MKQIMPFSDSRLDDFCAYCGNLADTRDHVPSKILLDTPYPENLPAVAACLPCNQSFSLDEEYVACLIECIIHGKTDPNLLSREKIKKTLSKKPTLLEKLNDAVKIIDGHTHFEFDKSRLENILIKLAKGHVRFENSESKITNPNFIWYMPLELMSENQRESYLSTTYSHLWPEIGSRAFIRKATEGGSEMDNWICVQENMYYYLYSGTINPRVKILIANYLACEIAWE